MPNEPPAPLEPLVLAWGEVACSECKARVANVTDVCSTCYQRRYRLAHGSKPRRMREPGDPTKQQVWRENNRELNLELNRINSRKPRARFKRAKLDAARRSKEFEISFAAYTCLIAQPCFYCNNFFPPSETGSGLDRIDNAKGYSISNCLPCCSSCNRTRGSVWSVEEARIIIAAGIEARRRSFK